MTSPEPRRSENPLDWALRYAALGLRVIPIKPGQKSPAPMEWVEAASSDPDVIEAWWNGLYSGHGVGLVLGRVRDDRWLFAVDIDQHGVDGAAVWDDLCVRNGFPPDTVTALTGGGGTHLIYWSPTEIRNSRLADGIDIRGAGGQILVEPTIHPNGQPYMWEDQAGPFDHKFSQAPDWLLDLLQPAEPDPPRQPAAPPGDDRPGDLWAAETAWSDLLERDGWTLHHVDRDGEQHWTRPGKDRREGTSATVGYKGSDILKVFTSSVPLLHPDETYTKIGYLAATRYDGDFSAAARALAQKGYRAPDVDLDELAGGGNAAYTLDPPEDGSEPADGLADDWRCIDLTDIANGVVEPPTPTILLPAGASQALIYPGTVNSLFGESGAGKTWVALAAIAEVIASGHTAMLIDLEDSIHGIYSRLVGLGLDPADIVARFAYVAPETAWRPDAADVFRGELADRDPALVVIDSTGEAMAAGGVKGNDDNEVARWFHVFPKAIARRGPAVLLTDHIPKDPNAPTAYAIGSQRKRAAINGAAYRVDAIKAPSRNHDGLLKIVTAKDRHGWHTQGRTASMVNITRTDGGTAVTLAVEDGGADDGPFRPTHLMERVSRWLELHPDQSKRTITGEVEGKAAYLRDAVDRLVDERHVAKTTAKRGDTYRVILPFREDEDHLHTLANGTASHRVPPRPEADGTRSTGPRPGPPSPTGDGTRSDGPQDPLENATASQPDGTRSPPEQTRIPLTPDNPDF